LPQFERDTIKERQREGIALAKKRGVYQGRKKALTPDKVTELCRRVTSEKKAALAREFGISRQTLYQYLGSSQPSPEDTDPKTEQTEQSAP
jgi:DNA invertase Pin-like site-specific DNA recombinase